MYVKIGYGGGRGAFIKVGSYLDSLLRGAFIREAFLFEITRFKCTTICRRMYFEYKMFYYI